MGSMNTDTVYKLTDATKDSGTRHDDQTTDKTEDKMKTAEETDIKNTSADQTMDNFELLESSKMPEGQITQLNKNSYITSALSKVIQTKNTEYSTTQSAETLAQAADGNTDYDKNTHIRTSITFGTKPKTRKSEETTTKNLPSEQKEDTMGLMNTNKVSEESVTPQMQASSTKITSEKEQTEKNKHLTTKEKKENLDIGNDAKTVDIDPSSTSTVTTPCVCPTTPSVSSNTQ
jgi:hypothetical protein